MVVKAVPSYLTLSHLTLEADFYRIKIRFGKLFADPRIFDIPPSFVRGYLKSKGLAPDRAESLYETSEDVRPLDDVGNPCTPAGTGKFRYEGKLLRSEFMQGASVKLEYCDFGSGLRPDEHRKSWMVGRWDDLSFEMKDWHHQHVDTGLASIPELYIMLKARARPTTIGTIELPVKGESILKASAQYLADYIGRLASAEGGSVEVYPANSLDNKERKALETRLGQQATPSTVYIILTTVPEDAIDAPGPR